MASSSLVLHAGGKLVTFEELREYRAPPPEGRWHPISHDTVLGTVKETLGEAGYEVKSEKLALNGKGTRFFGTLDLATPIATGVSLAVGIRNSTDKSFPLGFCGGSRSLRVRQSRVSGGLARQAQAHHQRSQEFSGRHRPSRYLDRRIQGDGSCPDQKDDGARACHGPGRQFDPAKLRERNHLGLATSAGPQGMARTLLRGVSAQDHLEFVQRLHVRVA